MQTPAGQRLLAALIVVALPIAAATQPPDSAPRNGGSLHARAIALAAAREGGFQVVFDSAEVGAEVILVQFGADGTVADERRLRFDHGSLAGRPAVDEAGRAWLPVRLDESADADVVGSVVLLGADGSRLAEVPSDQLLGVDDEGRGLLVEWDDHSRIVRFDPSDGGREVVLDLDGEEYAPPLGGCLFIDRALVPAGEDAFYLIDNADNGLWVRRFEHGGVQVASWVVGDTAAPAWTATAGRGLLFLAVDSSVTRFGPGALRRTWRLGEPVDAIAPDGDGAWVLLGDGPRVRHLSSDGSLGPVLDLDAPPPGMTYAERRDLLVEGDDASPEALLQTVLAARGAREASARRAFLELGAGAVDALAAAGDRWGWSASLDSLFAELLAADPDGVGERVLDLVGDDLGGHPPGRAEDLTLLLVEHWSHPSPRLRLLLERHLFGDDFASMLAHAAYSGESLTWEEDRPLPGSPGERFPAPLWVVDRYLEDLDGPGDLLDADAFFLAQFPLCADALETRLLDPGHPGHAATSYLLAEIADLLADPEPGALAAAPPELERRARFWSASADPEVADLGCRLAAVAGTTAHD